jgi:O-antigen/teichoic acid export membrane protein
VSSDPISTKRALAFVYAGYIFRYVYLLVLVPFYGRVLGAAAYGRVLAGMSLFHLVWMIAEGGFGIVGMRDVAQGENATDRAVLYGRHQAGRLLMAIPAALVGVGGTLLSPVLREQPLFGALATCTGLATAFNLGWYFQGTLRFRTSVLIEVLGFAISLSLILSLVGSPADGWLVLFSLFISSTLSTMVAHGIALRSIPWSGVRLRGAVGLVRESLAMLAHRGLTTVSANASVYVFSLFASAGAVGQYGAADRVAAVGLSLMQPATQVIFGLVSRRMADSEGDGAYRLMKTSFVALSLAGLGMLLGTLVLAGFIVPLALGDEFVPAVAILQTLGFIFPFEAVNLVINGFVLIPLRLDRVVTTVSFVSALATVTLIFVLGTHFGGIGVASSRVIASALSALLLVEVLRRRALLTRIIAA